MKQEEQQRSAAGSYAAAREKREKRQAFFLRRLRLTLVAAMIFISFQLALQLGSIQISLLPTWAGLLLLLFAAQALEPRSMIARVLRKTALVFLLYEIAAVLLKLLTGGACLGIPETFFHLMEEGISLVCWYLVFLMLRETGKSVGASLDTVWSGAVICLVMMVLMDVGIYILPALAFECVFLGSVLGLALIGCVYSMAGSLQEMFGKNGVDSGRKKR